MTFIQNAVILRFLSNPDGGYAGPMDSFFTSNANYE
jgi:hypothetical protein